MLPGQRASRLLKHHPSESMSSPRSWMRTRKPTLLETGLSVVLRLLPLKHGAHRLLDRVRPATWAKGPTVVDVPYRGHIVQIDVSDLVGWHFLVMRSFDPEIAEVLQKFASPHGVDVFWDVGANKGALSYAMAASLPGCKIVAIEPQRSLTGLLAENLETLARGRHEVFTVGIGETPGSFALVIPPGNGGRASLTAQHRDGSRIEQVEVVTAETVRRYSRYGWPTLVKIDVEGFEPEVIRSLRPAFASRRVRCCVFECHASEDRSFDRIRAATTNLGYVLYAITKTPFSTRLGATNRLVRGATDYALIRDDLYGSTARCSPPRRRGWTRSVGRAPAASSFGHFAGPASRSGRRGRRSPPGTGWM